MATRVRKAALLGFAAAVVLPVAAASADEQIAAPKADAYLQPVFLNNGNGLVAGDKLSFGADTTTYTTQKSLYDPKFDSGGNPVQGPAGPAGPPKGGAAGDGRTKWTALSPSRHRGGDLTATP